MLLSLVLHTYSMRYVLPAAVMMGTAPTYMLAWGAWRLLSAVLPARFYHEVDDRLYTIYQSMVLFFFENYTGVQVSRVGRDPWGPVGERPSVVSAPLPPAGAHPVPLLRPWGRRGRFGSEGPLAAMQGRLGGAGVGCGLPNPGPAGAASSLGTVTFHSRCGSSSDAFHGVSVLCSFCRLGRWKGLRHRSCSVSTQWQPPWYT